MTTNAPNPKIGEDMCEAKIPLGETLMGYEGNSARYANALRRIRESGENFDPTSRWMQQVAANALQPSIPDPGPIKEFSKRPKPSPAPPKLCAGCKLFDGCGLKQFDVTICNLPGRK